MPGDNMIPPRPSDDENWYTDDPTLQALLDVHLDDATLQAAHERLTELGQLAPQQLDAWARTADREDPELIPRSPTGERIDQVRFHPAYHKLQRAAREHETFTLAWHPIANKDRAPRTLALALGYLYAQAESGYYCPACMTDGAAFVLDRHAPEAIRDRYVPRLVTNDPEDGFEGAMYLTEKKGGSDVGGATETTAHPTNQEETYRLTGEKWFASNCVAEVAMVLARMPEADPDAGTNGLGLFVVPRHLPDGSRNEGVHIARLKDKLGVASMPTGEIVLDDATGYLVAGTGQGFKAMAEMVNLSRLYNAVASVAVARRALREGQRAGTHRETWGKPLREHSLFLRDLVELTLDVEGALAFVFDTIDVFDAWAHGDDEARPVLRMLNPLAKAATGKLAVDAASRGCEMLGGAGYIEEYVTPRLLRDAQVLPIWEGTTNIQGLDLLRALNKENALPAFLDHVHQTLDPAQRYDELAPALDEIHAATQRLKTQGKHLEDANRATAEAQALDLLFEAYHTHATARLARLAAHQDANPRAVTVANLYAARHVNPDRHASHQAIRDALKDSGQQIAYPPQREPRT